MAHEGKPNPVGSMKASAALAVMKVASQQWNLRLSNPANWPTIYSVIRHSTKNN